MEISKRSRQKFADLAAGYGIVRTIENVYDAQDFFLPNDFDYEVSGVRRSLCFAYEDTADFNDPDTHARLLRVYVDGIDEWGRKAPLGYDHLDPDSGSPPDGSLVDDARALVKLLKRDGAPIDDQGNLLPVAATPISLSVERFDRLGDPAVLHKHIERIEHGISKDPAAAIGASKELVESTCKFILDDYGVAYGKSADLLDLYKLVANELKLSRESVPNSAKGSKSAQRVLQNLSTAVQSLAELRNELGIGHGRTKTSAAYERHARLAANASRAVAEFLLETWHERRANAN